MADVEDLVAITKLNFRNITTTYFSTLLKINCFEAPFQTFMSKHIFATFEHKMVLKNFFFFLFFVEKKYCYWSMDWQILSTIIELKSRIWKHPLLQSLHKMTNVESVEKHQMHIWDCLDLVSMSLFGDLLK